MPEFPGRLRTPRLAAAPATPAKGEMYFDTVANVLYWYNGTTWISASGGAPSGPAGGDLSGTYPNPTVVKSAGDFAAGGNIGAGRAPVAGNGRIQLPVGGTTAADGINFGDAASLYLLDFDILKLNGSIQFTGGIDANGSKINNVDPPVAGTDAANKDYVDTNAGGPAGASTLTFYRGKLNLPLAKTIPGTSTWTNVDGWAEVYDLPAGDQGATTGFTVQKTGLYALTAQADWGANVTGARGIRFARNGALIGADGQVLDNAVSSSLPTRQSVHMRVPLTAGDVIVLQAWQNSGANIDLAYGANATTWMAWERLDAMADVAGPVTPKRAFYSGTNTAVPIGGGYTVLAAGTTGQDTMGAVTNGNTFTVPAGEGGRYRCTLWIQGKAQAVGTITSSQLLRNGVVSNDMVRLGHTATNTYPAADGSVELDSMVAGDAITFQLNHSDSVVRDISWRVTIEKIENVPGPQGPKGDSGTEVVAKGIRVADFNINSAIPATTPMPFDSADANCSHPSAVNLNGTITIPEDGWYIATAFWSVGGAIVATPSTTVDLFIQQTGSSFSGRVAEDRRLHNNASTFVHTTSQFFAQAGDTIQAMVGHNKGSTTANGVANSSIPHYLSVAKANGPKGDKGDPGPATEYALQTNNGASTSVPTGAWTRLPLGAVSAQSADAATCFRWNADGTITILADGWYSISTNVGGSGATTAGVQWGIWRDATDSTPAAPGATFRREIPAETFFIDTLEHVWFYNAGYRLGVSMFNRGTAQSFAANVAIARMASGPVGPTGPTGPAEVHTLPMYNELTLPASAPTGQVAWLAMSAAYSGAVPGGGLWLIRFQTSVWYVLGAIPLGTGMVIPTALTAATGWRATTATVTLPLTGNYMVSAEAEVTYSAIEPVGGIGIAGQNVAATVAPTILGTAGTSAAATRTQVHVTPQRMAITKGTNDILTLRANSNLSSTVTFARAILNALPLYLNGVA